MGNTYCVYKHTAPNGKVYIGITSQPPIQRFKNGKGYYHNEHFKRAITYYGWDNITHEILQTGLDRGKAIGEEKRLIAFYNATDYRYGYNLMTGGDGIGTHTQETIERLRKISTGKHWTEKQKEAQRQKMLGHKLPQELKDKLREMHMGDKNPFFGKQHGEESKRLIKEHCADFNGEKSVNAKRVRQYDLCGNFIKEYGAISTAAKENGFPNPYNISACCRDKLHTAYGYIWRYAEEAKDY